MITTKDPGKAHFYISLVKSFIRIIGCGFLMNGNLLVAGFLLLSAEVLGIAEEIF
jgi:hypothetical protein|tara:strand:- start:152 stop:316 length:165 start_codon:yes stop_codon:yes gene_type:complete